MARRESSSLFKSPSKNPLRAVTEPARRGEDAAAAAAVAAASPMARSHRPRSMTSFLPSAFRSHRASSSVMTLAKLVEEEDSHPPSLPAKLTKHEAYSPPARAPPAPPQSPRSSSAPRPGLPPSRLHKPESPSRSLRPDPDATPQQGRERSHSLAPPVARKGGHERAVSSPTHSRPTSYHSDQEESKAGKLGKRASWLGLSRSRPTSQELDYAKRPTAWVEMQGQVMDYNLSLLTRGEKIPELYSETADTWVYLFPRETGRPAQLKIHSPILASSAILHGMMMDEASLERSRGRARSFDGRRNLASEDATRNLLLYAAGLPPQGRNFPDNRSASDGSTESVGSLDDGPRQFHLYFPTKLSSTGPEFSERDVQRLVDIRNLFALLEGQPLLRTRASPSLFRMLVSVASLLQEFDFTNSDGSTYGEATASAFEFLCGIERLSDVSQSREKTIEGVILGERMRSLDLYNEAFSHAVGKYEAIKAVNPGLYNQVSPTTRKRLDRAFLDLGQRQRTAELRLTDFEFPSLFAGIAASTSSVESKFVRFKAWKSHFSSLRKVTLSYYKDLHGQWPPKAGSKKNGFVEGGLNRLVLKGLYQDFCDLYDLLADRQTFTTRGINASEDKDTSSVDPTAAALRRLLAEFDRSSPPVQPPMPCDVPLVPTMATLYPGYHRLGPKEQNALDNMKLKDHESQLVMLKSHNMHPVLRSSFLDTYQAWEAKEARGKTCAQLVEMRYGHWIFLYAVLQSLPMLVVDAPGLRYTEGVEYFLCEPSLGNPPWMEDVVKREWYGIANTGHAVVLPSDLVVHGVEGIYRRSHCWTEAQKWINENVAGSTYVPSTEIDRTAALSPLQPPPGFAGGELAVRPFPTDEAQNRMGSPENLAPESRGRSRQSQRQSIALGLERLPIPVSAPPSPSLSAGGARGQSPGGLTLWDTNSGRRVSGSGPSGGTPSPEPKGSTFDDILGSMPSEKPKATGGLMSRFK